MTEDYANACLIDDAIRGKHVTVVCLNRYDVRHKLYDLVRMCDYMRLPYRLYKVVGHEAIVIGETIEDGGIDFECMTNPNLPYKRMCDRR